MAPSALSYDTGTYSHNIFSDLQAEPGLERARATTVVKLETLAAFERRMEDVARKSGPNVAARGVERQIMFTNNAMAAARQEALLEERVANARLWSGRLMKLGLVCAQFSDCNEHGRIYFL